MERIVPVTRRASRRLAAAVALALAAGLCWEFWLFRTRVQMLGKSEMLFEWRWGWAHQASVDNDGDGRPEQVWRMAPYSGGFNCNYEVLETWKDTDGDGVLEKFAWDNAAGTADSP